MLNNTTEESNNNNNTSHLNCFLSVFTELGSSCVKRFQSKIEKKSKKNPKIVFNTLEREKERE